MAKEMKIERYHVQSHGGKGSADLEYAEDGWPILVATNDKPAPGISREFRWAYGPNQRVWVRLPDGKEILLTGITQCWLDENDRVYHLVGRPVNGQWLAHPNTRLGAPLPLFRLGTL